MRTLTFNRILGTGAMGTVYHAELKAPGGFVRPCAVKVMKATGPDHEHFMARMRDEARLLGMLQDESILGVSELAHVGDRDAVIMDFVEGCDLADLVKIGQVPAKALAEMGAEIAGTLFRAHNAKHPSNGRPLGVIHRDVKPANVMVTARGGVKLLDFGVARAAFSDRESQTQGLVLGTLNYFPPEILQGGEPTQAVDIYGLGLTLWECATGKEWGSPQAQQQRFEKRVDQRLSELGASYAPLAPVLRAILQWDPLLRPDGGGAERSLLQVASTLPGESLRTWARDAVPRVIVVKEKESRALRDGLVGKTLEVRALPKDDTPDDVLPPPPAPPPKEAAKVKEAPKPAPAAKPVPRPAPKPAPKPSSGKRRSQPASNTTFGLVVAGTLFGILIVLGLFVVVLALGAIVFLQ